MRMHRPVVLLIGVLLLASVATASAECAWVFWQQTSTLRPEVRRGNWMPAEGVASQAQCEQLLETTMKEWMAPLAGQRKEKVDRRSVLIEWSGGKEMRQFTCLPDTIDPRGPKGS
jgi:hypothetical protein